MTRPASNQPPDPTLRRNRRIGKKVLLADRLSHAVGKTKRRNDPFRHVRAVASRPKSLAAALTLVVAIGVAGSFALQAYTSRQTVAEEAAAAQELATQKAKAAAADECRRGKLAQKADLVGKVTFDELYDDDECDR